MATLRQQLVDQVEARARAIPGLAGVFVWRVAPIPQDGLPCAVVRDQACESRLAATNVHEHRLTFAVDIFAYDLASARDLAGLLLESIRSDVRWKVGGIALAVNTEPLRDSLETKQEERFIAGARVEFVVVYRTPVFTPSAVYP
jgi:hypothetical protein